MEYPLPVRQFASRQEYKDTEDSSSLEEITISGRGQQVKFAL